MQPNETKGSGNEKSKVALGLWRISISGLYLIDLQKGKFLSANCSFPCFFRVKFRLRSKISIFCLPYKALGIIYNVLATQAYKPTLSINWVVLGTSWLNNLVFAFLVSLVYFCFFPLYWQIISPSERFDRVLLNKGNTSSVRALVRCPHPPPPRFLTSPPQYDYTKYS